MTLPSTLLHYEAEIEVLERAMASEAGIRVRFDDRDAARNWRQRVHMARALLRRKNAEVYERGHPLHGATEYDILVLQMLVDEDGKWWIYARKNNIIPKLIENLEVGA